MAKLIFRYATMGSGKSAEILQIHYNYEQRGIKGLLLIPEIDTTSDGFIRSRLGLLSPAIKFKTSDNLIKLFEEYLEPDVKYIIIDECNFLREEQVDQLKEIVNKYDIAVMCYGLLTNFRTKLFEGSKRLIEIADIKEPLSIKTLCSCGKSAIYNARFINGELVTEGEEVVIDKKDGKINPNSIEYRPICDKCYRKLKNKK